MKFERVRPQSELTTPGSSSNSHNINKNGFCGFDTLHFTADLCAVNKAAALCLYVSMSVGFLLGAE